MRRGFRKPPWRAKAARYRAYFFLFHNVAEGWTRRPCIVPTCDPCPWAECTTSVVQIDSTRGLTRLVNKKGPLLACTRAKACLCMWSTDKYVVLIMQ